jgi:hypothetical protein
MNGPLPGLAPLPEALPPWSLVHGASWLTDSGEVLIVPGFHEEWIESHRELVGGCANVCEVVLRKSWISVAVYSEGYVELLAPRRGDADILARIERLLGSNPGKWRNVLVMFMDEEGYESLRPGDFGPDGKLLPGRRASIVGGACARPAGA